MKLLRLLLHGVIVFCSSSFPPNYADITLAGVLKAAQKKAKLQDFGITNENDFKKHFDLIMSSKEYKQQKLTNLGFVFANLELQMCFVRRLKFVDFLKQNPDVLKTKVVSPVFVMGLPRTGTTLMHRLLSLDPRVRSPYLWELLNPVPIKNSSDEDEINKDRQKRAKHIQKLLESRKKLGDSSVDHIHEIGYDQPEECLVAMSDEMPLQMQFLYPNYMNADAFLSLPALPAYAWYRKILQLLSYQVTSERKNPRNWMLKRPMHLFYIKEIAKVFPDAKIIWTHRHPVSAVPSMCSLIKAFHKFYYEPEGRNDSELGRKISNFTQKMLQKAPEDIKNAGLDSKHIIYNDLVNDPKAIVKDIYSAFNWPYTEEYDKLLDEYLQKNEEERHMIKKKRNTQGGGTLHKYEPEEFGLTSDELSNGVFAEYCKKFNVPMSRN